MPYTEQLVKREPKKKEKPTEQLLSFLLREDLAKSVQVDALLSKKERNRLLDFLWGYLDIF